MPADRPAEPPPRALGADPDQLERLAAAFAAAAAAVGGLVRRLRRRLDALVAAGRWTGPDSRRLLHGVGADLLPALRATASSLEACARACRHHAEEERRAAAPAPAVGWERRSARGDGLAVRRVGDPDAAVVVALVPGVGTDAHDVDRLLEDALRLHAVATVRHGSDDLAVVSWLGYDPPDTVPGAIDPRPATRGAAALVDDVASWRAGGADRVVLVGHSYGAVVAGRAAAGGGAEVLVQLGAPGAGPPGPTAWRRLRRPGLRWLAARADGDPIRWASPWAVPWYGPDPTALTGRLPTRSRGHGGYLADRAVLDAVARLAGRRRVVGYRPRP